MRHIAKSALLIALLLAAHHAAAGQYSIFITATDNKGNPVVVSAKDLHVEAAGERVTTTSLNPAVDLPITFAIVIDNSGSMRDKVGFVRTAAMEVFDRFSSDRNRAVLVISGDKVVSSSQFIEREELSSQLRKLEAKGGGNFEAGIAAACQILRKMTKPADRKVIITITDGEIGEEKPSTITAVGNANDQHASVFFVGLLGQEPRRGRRMIEEIASGTGGGAVLLESPGKFIERLGKLVDSQLLLTFEFEPKKSAPFVLKVSGEDKKLKISAPASCD